MGTVYSVKTELPDQIFSVPQDYIKTSGDYDTVGNVRIIGVDTDNAARTITLKSEFCISGFSYIIKDVDGNAETNNISIVTEGDETIDDPVVNLHFSTPSAFIAYKFESLEPINIVPLRFIAGVESIQPFVTKFHFSEPFGLIAYNLLS